MSLYIGTKKITAVIMNRANYNRYRGWELPADEDGSDEGYLVEYVDGGPSNHPDHVGYISWSPKDVFENSYKENGSLSFGHVLEEIKHGKYATRKGWNGRGMSIFLHKGEFCGASRGFDPDQEIQENHPSTQDGISFSLFNNGPEGTSVRLPCLAMKTASGAILHGWLASQTDLLAEDWEIINE